MLSGSKSRRIKVFGVASIEKKKLDIYLELKQIKKMYSEF